MAGSAERDALRRSSTPEETSSRRRGSRHVRFASVAVDRASRRECKKKFGCSIIYVEREATAPCPSSGCCRSAAAPMLADQAGEPGAEAVIGFAGGRQRGAAPQTRADNRIAERRDGDQMHQHLSVGAIGCSTGRRGGDAALVQAIGDVAHDGGGADLLSGGIDGREPSKALREPVAIAVEYLI